MKFVILESAFEDCTLASGCGKACVGDQGMLQGFSGTLGRAEQ